MQESAQRHKSDQDALIKELAGFEVKQEKESEKNPGPSPLHPHPGPSSTSVAFGPWARDAERPSRPSILCFPGRRSRPGRAWMRIRPFVLAGQPIDPPITSAILPSPACLRPASSQLERSTRNPARHQHRLPGGEHHSASFNRPPGAPAPSSSFDPSTRHSPFHLVTALAAAGSGPSP